MTLCYVSANPHVLAGLGWQGAEWAATAFKGGSWHPLTWLSLMLDAQIFGLRPGGYHLTNLLLHAASTVLLFLLLRRTAGATWRSALVAALFALHPLHVESVAWVAERKDVLSTFFEILALWAYALYAEAKLADLSGVERSSARASKQRDNRIYYSLALVFFVFALMSKPMAVTLPIIMLLMDWWPLRRIGHGRSAPLSKTLAPLVREKASFFVLAVACGLVTLFAQNQAGALPGVLDLPLRFRVANAALSIIQYIAQMFWPVRLSVFYPYEGSVSLWWALASALMIAAVSVAVLRWLRRWPSLGFGWLW